MDILKAVQSHRQHGPATAYGSAKKGQVTQRHTRLVVDILFLLIMIFGINASANAAADSTINREYQLKAAFLYNFTKFVEWPETAWGESRSNFILCISGSSNFNQAIYLIENKQVKGRLIEIKSITDPELAGDCHLLFIGNHDQNSIDTLLKAINGRSVLTVSEADGFMPLGGIIMLRTINNKVRFDINQRAAHKQGLEVSSRLLQLADHVIRSPQPALK